MDQASQSIPNPTVLTNTIPLLEAHASSEIENIVTTTDDLFRHMDEEDGAHDAATRETRRYRTALHTGFPERHRPRTHRRDRRAGLHDHQGREMQVRALPCTRIANPATPRPG
nr:Fic/DOC family N-terminal domain-containing protein [Ornithinimicrobium sp. F0845]